MGWVLAHTAGGVRMEVYPRFSAVDTTLIIMVPYTAAELIKMRFIPVITANDTEILLHRP